MPSALRMAAMLRRDRPDSDSAAMRCNTACSHSFSMRVTDAVVAVMRVVACGAKFEREILRERTRAGLAHARQNGKRLGRPATAALHTAEIRTLHRAGVSKSEIARVLESGALPYVESWVIPPRNRSASLRRPTQRTVDSHQK